MTPEEFQEFVKDEKNKNTFDTIVQSMGYKAESNFKAIELDRDTERKKKREYQEKFTELEKKLAELESKYYIDDNDTDGKKVSPAEKLERELTKLRASSEKDRIEKQKIQDRLYNSIRQTEIIKALEQANIDPSHYSLLSSAYLGQSQIEIEDDKEAVLINKEPVSDFFKKWAMEEGKIYVKVPVNTGVGESRFRGGASGKTITREEFYKLSPKAQSEFSTSKGGKIID
jgi:hypothetical protein